MRVGLPAGWRTWSCSRCCRFAFRRRRSCSPTPGWDCAGAVEISRHQFLVAALLLQLKTVLDNADGQLARLSGRVTAFGRYLDSESDLVVNAAIFVALGTQIGPWLARRGVRHADAGAERQLQRRAPLPPRARRAGGRDARGRGRRCGARARLCRRLRAAGSAGRGIRGVAAPRAARRQPVWPGTTSPRSRSSRTSASRHNSPRSGSVWPSGILRPTSSFSSDRCF